MSEINVLPRADRTLYCFKAEGKLGMTIWDICSVWARECADILDLSLE
jgi:hypothetical protein